MASRMGARVEGPETRLIATEDLEEAREDALERTLEVQARKKTKFYRRLLKDHGIKVGRMVLLYNNHHKDFPGIQLHIC